jgi:hypothetical protein
LNAPAPVASTLSVSQDSFEHVPVGLSSGVPMAYYYWISSSPYCLFGVCGTF